MGLTPQARDDMAASAPAITESQSRDAMRRVGTVRAVLLMTRPLQIALIAAVFANGVLLAAWRGDSAGPATTAVAAAWPALLLIVLAAAAIHLANEAADHETDRRTRRTPFSGGSGALAASSLSPRVPLALALALSGLVVVLALMATGSGAIQPAATALLLLGLAGGLAYSLPPVAVERRGWGEPLNAVLGALLLPLYGVAALAGAAIVLDVVAFLPFFFVAFASVMATAWPDRAADGATGKTTMQVRLSPVTLRRIALGAAVAFILSTFLSAATDAIPLAFAGLAVTPLLVLGLHRYTRVTSPLANVAAMVALSVLTTVALIGALAGSGRLV